MQGKNVVDAAKANGIQHLVFSGLRSAKEVAGLEGCSHFENKKAIFDYIVKQGLCFSRILYSHVVQSHSVIVPFCIWHYVRKSFRAFL
jgi:NmrA-like family